MNTSQRRRADMRTLYRHYRREGNSPRTAIALARFIRTCDAWVRSAYTSDYGRLDAETRTWRGPHLPEGSFREALAALDPALDRWSLRVTASPDWDTAEGAEEEASNAGIGVWWSDEDPDDVAAKVGESWTDLEYGYGDDDPRPEGGRVHYADTGLTRGGRYSRETLYVYYSAKDARQFFIPPGTARGLVDLVAKERAGESVEAFAEYLGAKYAERGGIAPLHLHVEVCWDGNVVGEAGCGGCDPDQDAQDPFISALVSLDLLDEALDEAEKWVAGVVHGRLAAAERAARAAVETCVRLGSDAALGADNPERRFPAAAYAAARKPKEDTTRD